MCVDNPVPFHSDEPIIAYKAMKHPLSSMSEKNIRSLVAGNYYRLGEEYEAGKPLWTDNVGFSSDYNQGFHAYEKLEDAMNHYAWSRIVVKVELSDLTFKGTEIIFKIGDNINAPVYIANKCKFLEIVKRDESLCV